MAEIAIMASSAIMIILGLFVLRAYVPTLIRRRRDDPIFWVGLSFVIVYLVGIERSLYWDLIWPLTHDPSNPWPNLRRNILVIFAEYCALHARLMTLPKAARSSRNIFTATIHPSHRQMKMEDEE